jgi:hypothetical protein
VKVRKKHSWNLQQFMGLQTQLPLWMLLAKIDRQPGIAFQFGAVHRLHEKMMKRQGFIFGKVLASLRDHDLQLTAGARLQHGTHFWADASPVHAGRHWQGAIGFKRNFKTGRMHAIKQRLIELQQRFTAGKYHVFAGRVVGRPQAVDCLDQSGCIVFTAQYAVGADKISIAKLADRGGAICFTAAPEVAAGKTAKHRRPSGLRALALQRIKNFLDAISQDSVRLVEVYRLRQPCGL